MTDSIAEEIVSAARKMGKTNRTLMMSPEAYAAFRRQYERLHKPTALEILHEAAERAGFDVISKTPDTFRSFL